MFRWIQISKQESDELQTNGMLPKSSGYHYTDNSGVDMVEYHVDSCETFQERMNKDTIFGGNLSVRMKKDEKPLIIFGHDECIFKQYLLTKRAWTAPGGETVLVLKDDGQGVMISAFQAHEFGLGIELSDNEFNKVNEF